MFAVLSDTVTLEAVPVVSWFNVPTTKSIVLSASWYVAVIPVSVLLENIAPAVSEIKSARVVPPIVIAAASSVPSMSALPDTSKVVKSSSPAIVTFPSASVIRSVSDVCPIVVPLTITLSTVRVVSVPRLVMFDCAAPVTVAAVPLVLPVTLPVKLPVNEVDVNTPLEGL